MDKLAECGFPRCPWIPRSSELASRGEEGTSTIIASKNPVAAFRNQAEDAWQAIKSIYSLAAIQEDIFSQRLQYYTDAVTK